MSGLRQAVAFLTRIPVRCDLEENQGALAGSVPWFPVVGAVLGMVVAGVYAAGLLVLPALVAATTALCVGLMLTGALHEDGLGDVADAFWGGWEPEERVRILKDPHLGTYGVVAVVLSLLLRVGALSAMSGRAAVAIVPAAYALSRSASILCMALFTPLGPGLGSSFVLSLSRPKAVVGMLGAVVIGVVALGWWAVPGVALAALSGWGMGALSRRKLGGITGDILGATQQVAEVSLLILGAAASAKGLPLPWQHA